MGKQHKTASGDFLAFVDDLKREKTIAFPVGDRTFYLRGPEVFSDAEMATMNDPDADIVTKARLMIDDYDGFVAVDPERCTAMTLNAWYTEQFGDDAAEAAGESGASSTS